MADLKIENISENVLVDSLVSTLQIFNKENQELAKKLSKSKETNNRHKIELDSAVEKRGKELIKEHQAALKKKDDEIGKLNEDYQAALKKKDGEIGKLNEDHQAALKKKDDEIGKLNEEHQAALKKKDDEIRKLNEDHQAALNKVGCIEKNNHNLLYALIQSGIKKIGDLLTATGKDAFIEYCNGIKEKNENTSNNKDIFHYNEYLTIDDITESLDKPDSVLNQIANIVWWYKQTSLKDEIRKNIENIEDIVILFYSNVLIPLEMYGCKVHMPSFSFIKTKDLEKYSYKNSQQWDKLFNDMFETSLEDYMCCRIETLAYKNIKGAETQGSFFEYYT